jgi:hypothetical protein
MRKLFYRLTGKYKTCKHIFISTELFDKSIDPKCTICKHSFDWLNKDNVFDREKFLKDIAKSGQENRRERRKANR